MISSEKMNHKTRSTIDNNKTAPVLVAIAALAAVMVAGTVAVGSGNIVFAGKGNDGISVPTDTQQKQECQTAGGASLITGSCTALSTNTITQSGGLLGGLSVGSGDKMSSGGKGHDKGNGNGNDGISVPTDTQQKQECQTAGGVSPISLSCTAASTNTNLQSGGLMREVPK
jgi:hypothetical protein